LPMPNFNAVYGGVPAKKATLSTGGAVTASYPADQPSLAAMMAALQMQSVGLPLNSNAQPQALQINPTYQQGLNALSANTHGIQTPQSSVGSNPDSLHNYLGASKVVGSRGTMSSSATQNLQGAPSASHSANRTGMGMMGMGGQSPAYGLSPTTPVHQPTYQAYMYQMFQQQQQQQQSNAGAFHA